MSFNFNKILMIKILMLSFSVCFFIQYGISQPENSEKTKSAGRSNAVSLNFNTPVGGYLKDLSNFSMGATYSWSKERFGNMSSVPTRTIGFTANIGVDYYFGEKETYYNQTVKYKGTTYLHAYGGAIYNPCAGGNIILTTGPSLEIYNGNSQFGFGVNLSGSISFSKYRNFGISPNIFVLKHGNSDVLFAGGLGINMTF